MKKRRLQQDGFALIEAIVAIVILGVAITTLAALMTQVSRGALRVSGDSYKHSVMTQEVNRIEAMPFDSVAVGTQTVSVAALPYPHTRTITVTAPDTRVRKVQIVIVPSGYYFKRDTAIVYRRNSAPTNSFNTGT
ncbi:MAG: prepilin-type N-terminal cleavage/methylation domain-containing protein [Gemmatimonadaceae bacterium]|nr:prepilin-type N-terminal cleavage/methylation domain-containing protein [Gemmatimonadaceae bacterium]